MKHIICYSGGHSSGLVAIEVAIRYGKENVILLNHDISSWVEDGDIKRFKKEVADYLGLPITYQNYNDLPLNQLPNQFEVCEELGSFVNPATRQALCTTYLKTVPFTKYLETYFPNKDCIVYYGFDKNEPNRIERRDGILKDIGYESDYPLALWSKEGIDIYNEYQIKPAMEIFNKIVKRGRKFKSIARFIEKHPEYCDLLSLKDYSGIYDRVIYSTKEIGIEPPNTYSQFKHANCKGCLKGGQQHWYVVYCVRYDVFCRAKESEEKIGHSIIKGHWLKDLEVKFELMKLAGVPATEHIPHQTFWKEARKFLEEVKIDEKPCECIM